MPKNIYFLKVEITGTKKEQTTQYKAVNSIANMKITDYTTKLKSLRIGIDALINNYNAEKKLVDNLLKELERINEN